MSRRVFVVLLPALTAGVLVAQSPPPKLLPPSVTGQPVAGSEVTPAGGNTAVPQPPMARFLGKPGVFPPETDQAVFAVRIGTDWLYRMNLPSGKFLPGFDPAARKWVTADGDFRQALATLALADSARFTGDERHAARASGAVLALLSRTKIDGPCRTPTAPADRVGVASLTALAIYRLPNPDPKLLLDAAGLVAFVRQQMQTDGGFATQSGDAPTTAGFALQALAACLRVQPADDTRAAFSKAVAYQAARLKTETTPAVIAATLPALVDYALMTNKDAAVVGMVFAATDKLCAAQITAATPQQAMWVGGFPATGGLEPTADSASCALALCHAARLTRQIPDAARFTKYRTAAAGGMAFARNLQFTDESAEHFDRAFRARYVVGGVRATPSDGTLTLDAAAETILAHLAFLECGTEQRLR